MAGYTSFWDCRLCNKQQESIDTPKNQVCDECMTPLAYRLLVEKFPGATLSSAGIDSTYWMRKAESYCESLLRHWLPR